MFSSTDRVAYPTNVVTANPGLAALLADPELDARFEELNATATNIVGINRWLDRMEAQPQT